MTTYERLFALEQFGVKLGLDNIRALTAALGHPQLAYPTIHIAGTNGKGSVAAMVERGLRSSGYRTGLYTSPHLDRVEERVAVDGSPVAADVFEACARDVLDLAASLCARGRLEASPTFFETTTAIAFELFRRAGIEVGVVEVGLGGRYDATNVVDPVVSAITSIALDHERHLGPTLAAIAAEKAGIARRNVPLVVGDLPTEAAAVVEAAAAAVGAPVLHAAGVIRATEIVSGVATVWGATGSGTFNRVRLALRGRHQVANAAVAAAIIDVLGNRGLRTDVTSIVAGLSGAEWPGRLEWLELPKGRLLVDAAHNPAGSAALATYLLEAGVAPLPVVLSVMADKDVEAMATPLAQVAQHFIATQAASARALEAAALRDRLTSVVPERAVVVEANPLGAVDRALAAGQAVAAGSIYFTGPLRARLLEAGARSI